MNQMSLTFPLPCHSPWPKAESLKYILAAALSLCPGGLDIYASDLTVWLSLHILCIVLSNDLQDYISDRHLSPILIINPFALFAFSQSFRAISKNSFHHLLEEGLCHSVWVNVSEMPQFHSEHSFGVFETPKHKRILMNFLWVNHIQKVSYKLAREENICLHSVKWV